MDSPRRADSHETLPGSGRHPPPEQSAFFFLLTSIAMRTLQNLYHSISLDGQNPTHSVLMLSDHWLNGYAYFCTLDLRVSTFKLLTKECNRHADTSRPIPFDSPRRDDSHETLPDSGRHMPAEVSASFILQTSLAMRTLRNLYNSIPLVRWIPTAPVPMLSNR